MLILLAPDLIYVPFVSTSNLFAFQPEGSLPLFIYKEAFKEVENILKT